MAVFGTIILIWVLAFLVWFFLAPKFNKIGSKVTKHIEKSKNNGKDE